MFKLEIYKSSLATILRCSGRLVWSDGAESLLPAVMSQDQQHILVDLSEVNSIDAAGLGALAQLERWARRETRTIHVLNPARTVRKALDVTRLSSVLRIVPAAAETSYRRWLEILGCLISRDDRSLPVPVRVGSDDEEESVAGVGQLSSVSR